MTWLVIEKDGGSWQEPRLAENEADAARATAQARDWRGTRVLAVDLDWLEKELKR